MWINRVLLIIKSLLSYLQCTTQGCKPSKSCSAPCLDHQCIINDKEHTRCSGKHGVHNSNANLSCINLKHTHTLQLSWSRVSWLREMWWCLLWICNKLLLTIEIVRPQTSAASAASWGSFTNLRTVGMRSILRLQAWKPRTWATSFNYREDSSDLELCNQKMTFLAANNPQFWHNVCMAVYFASFGSADCTLCLLLLDGPLGLF